MIISPGRRYVFVHIPKTGGTALTLAGIALGSLPLYLAALTFAGTGFGTCFYASLRTIVPLCPPEERGERQVGAEVLDEKDQRDVLAQGGPQPDQAAE